MGHTPTIAGLLARLTPAQVSFEQPDFAPLPDPPVLEAYLFENPWPLVGLLAVLALIVLVLLVQRDKARLGLAAAGALVLAAGGAFLTARTVQTDRETIRARAHELVDAVAAVDVGALDDLLAPDMTYRGIPVASGEWNRQQTIDNVERYIGGVPGLTSHDTRDVQVLLQGPNVAVSQIRVVVVPKTFEVSQGTWWRVDWARENDRWRVTGVRPLWIAGRNLD